MDIDTEYPDTRNDLAFLIADNLARDAVDDYNASLPANALLAHELKRTNNQPTKL